MKKRNKVWGIVLVLIFWGALVFFKGETLFGGYTVYAAEPVYTFNTVAGKVVSTYSSNYDLTITVMGRDGCYNTKTTLNNIIALGLDKEKGININFVDCDKNSKEAVTNFAKSYAGSGIHFCYDTGTTASNVMWKYANTAGMGNSLTLPLTIFANGDGTIRKITSGVLNQTYIRSLVNNKGSLDAMLTFSVEGTENYDYANSVLTQLNDLRTSLGLTKLTMDKELLDIAMQRAAEIAVYYAHTRPNDTSCFSLATGNYWHGENIAIGYGSPSAVMYGWTNSSGHYANMTKDVYRSVGIGCFKASGGTLCWVQFFSSKTPSAIHKTGSVNTSRNMAAVYKNLELSFRETNISKPLAEAGEEFGLTVINCNSTYPWCTQVIPASDFNFTSSNANIVTVNNSGVCTVKGVGKVTITATLKSNSKISLKAIADVGHSHTDSKNKSGWSVSKKATVYSAGVKCIKCKVCGDVLKKISIAQLKPAKVKLKSISNVSKGVKITWGKVSGADTYRVYRKMKGGSWKRIATNIGSSYTDKKTKTGVTYYYTVRANNEAGLSAYNAKGLAITRLAKPKLKVASNTTNGVKIKWSKSTGAKGYIVYRKVKGGSWKNLGKTTRLSYIDKKAKSGTTYYYVIRAYSGSSKSILSSSVSRKYLKAPIVKNAISKKKGITFKWGKVTGASGYYVYRATGNGTYKKVATIRGGSKMSYIDAKVKKGKIYKYKVKAYSGKTVSSISVKAIKIKDKY